MKIESILKENKLFLEDKMSGETQYINNKIFNVLNLIKDRRVSVPNLKMFLGDIDTRFGIVVDNTIPSSVKVHFHKCLPYILDREGRNLRVIFMLYHDNEKELPSMLIFDHHNYIYERVPIYDAEKEEQVELLLDELCTEFPEKIFGKPSRKYFYIANPMARLPPHKDNLILYINYRLHDKNLSHQDIYARLEALTPEKREKKITKYRM